MAMYFFDITDADGTVLDDVGQSCPTTEEATKEAILALTDIAKEEMSLRRCDTIEISVRNDEDSRVVRIRLTLTVEIQEVEPH